jgi:hypothetical protein
MGWIGSTIYRFVHKDYLYTYQSYSILKYSPILVKQQLPRQSCIASRASVLGALIGIHVWLYMSVYDYNFKTACMNLLRDSQMELRTPKPPLMPTAGPFAVHRWEWNYRELYLELSFTRSIPAPWRLYNWYNQQEADIEGKRWNLVNSFGISLA